MVRIQVGIICFSYINPTPTSPPSMFRSATTRRNLLKRRSYAYLDPSSIDLSLTPSSANSHIIGVRSRTIVHDNFGAFMAHVKSDIGGNISRHYGRAKGRCQLRLEGVLQSIWLKL